MDHVFPGARRVAAYDAPMPCDQDYRNTHPDPTVPPCVGVQARAHVGVFEDDELLAYARTSWAVVKDHVRSAVMRMMIAKLAASGTQNFSVDDTGGTSRSLRFYGPSANANLLYNATDVYANDEVKVGYGTDGTAAAGTDDDLVAQDTMVTATVDIVGRSAFARISHIHAGGNITVREVGLKTAWNLDGVTRPRFLIDRATSASVAGGPVDPLAATLNTGNKIRIDYEVRM